MTHNRGEGFKGYTNQGGRNRLGGYTVALDLLVMSGRRSVEHVYSTKSQSVKSSVYLVSTLYA